MFCVISSSCNNTKHEIIHTNSTRPEEKIDVPGSVLREVKILTPDQNGWTTSFLVCACCRGVGKQIGYADA